MRQVQLLFLLMMMAVTAVAQEHVDSLVFNRSLMFAEAPERVSRKSPLALPFIDDFSAESIYPDPLKWQDNLVYVNTGFPLFPPSVGVATFDGLNATGRPYVKGAGSYGSSDTLTSQEIDLGGLTAADSVYLSFYYQVKGLGNAPEGRDSLVLEFKVNDTTWRNVWSQVPTLLPTDEFIPVFIAITANQYFRNDFQFRFRNYSSRSGNIDHWHLDYVQLDKGRTRVNPVLNDVAFTEPGRSLLRFYYSMPLRQIKGFVQQELADSLYAASINHFNVIKNTTFRYDAREDCSNTLLKADFFQTINYPAESDTILREPMFTNELESLIDNAACDSLVVTTRYFLNNSPPDPTTSFNDTVVHRQHFYNYFAYDDGTAEVAYRLEGNAAKFAYQFRLNYPDTLRGIAVHFAHVDKDISNDLINLIVWKTLDRPTGFDDEELYRMDFQKPVYVDSINGFYYYRLDTALALADTFYVGIQQVGTDNMRIGFDQNHDASGNLWYFVSGAWTRSTLQGALMVRPLVGDSLPVPVGVPTAAAPAPLALYPNPVSDVLFLPSLSDGDGELIVFDVFGRPVLTTPATNRLTVSTLPSGWYLLQHTATNGTVASRPFIKAD